MRQYLSKQNRTLLSELVRTDFKLRYQGSVLGYAWSLLRPLLLFTIIYIVFVYFFKISKGIPHYPVYLLLGIVIWNFFSEMTSQSIGSIVGRGSLIRKIHIPRWIIVLSSSISALISLGLNLVVVGIMIVVNDLPLHYSILLLPLVLLEAYIFALGVSLFLSAAFVKYRDVSYIWEVIMQAAFYATPIIYPVSKIVNQTLQQIIMLNPMAEIIQLARYLFIPDPSVATASTVFNGSWQRLVPHIIVIVVFFIGLTYFHKRSKYFAENV